MAERRKIALIFSLHDGWMGGAYYITNLISTLNSLPDEEKPIISVCCHTDEEYRFVERQTDYPYLTYRQVRRIGLMERAINKIARFGLGRNIISYNSCPKDADVIYPVFDLGTAKPLNKCLYWIPDFQELHLPHLFSEADLKWRKLQNQRLSSSELPVVFSSEDACKDFVSEYRHDRSNTYIYHFTAKTPKYGNETDRVLKKYGVTRRKYLFCANQFWTHKNHLLLFEAIGLLKKEGIEVRLLCSGNFSDVRNPQYITAVREYIDSNGLKDNISLLGLIDREDQLTLMNESRALVQPSLFEGWSTSIEEAKAMNVFMILSDLDVHKEQVDKNYVMFSRNDARDLADKIKQVCTSEINLTTREYESDIRSAARNFLAIVDSVKTKRTK